jgi:23S rRNA (cytidine1920-2'-O)/16S rRNA (cytidine1409-2'-O)-methyltransferase
VAIKQQRLDLALVERGLVPTREKAQALILAGEVFVNSQKAQKPGQPIESGAAIEVRKPLRYVSRGGLKLDAALQAFNVRLQGKVCLDIGTSTGGFADCLLQNGALRVHCVDTGAGQIDWKLRTDQRIVLHENTNARYLQPHDIGESASLIVCDVSFISATLIIPAVVPLLEDNGELVVLVKPQFEVGREHVGKGGIVREPALHTMALERVQSVLYETGFKTAFIDSPITGAEGNREFLMHGKR